MAIYMCTLTSSAHWYRCQLSSDGHRLGKSICITHMSLALVWLLPILYRCTGALGISSLLDPLDLYTPTDVYIPSHTYLISSFPETIILSDLISVSRLLHLHLHNHINEHACIYYVQWYIRLMSYSCSDQQVAAR